MEKTTTTAAAAAVPSQQESDESFAKNFAEVCSAKSETECTGAYDKWAENYDHDLASIWLGSQRLVEFIVDRLGPECHKGMRILDVGAGTGKVRYCTHLLQNI